MSKKFLGYQTLLNPNLPENARATMALGYYLNIQRLVKEPSISCTTPPFVVNLKKSKTIFSYVERNGQKEGDEEACHQIFKREAR